MDVPDHQGGMIAPASPAASRTSELIRTMEDYEDPGGGTL